ncbi:SDR family NAD(P)-dependent oxidoreductase [Telmatospirillum siberiense]|uniref:NAD(P)-dependent oxidoreductase n=1 Tax=Telmatospirillum siberiense TaxID=382514 RepID=A0A2N3Q0E0_9PROT|nr:SDR family NAD(P)-dependent oxidoreductase [Telmatospirillum siberiense]PKU26114.1 NAD(P)-dependent oxidoreductase [Telmatospirillum siberiense]
MARLDGKIAVVTGSGSGIGETTAKLFAREGATVVLVARREETLRRVKSEIEAEGGNAVYVSADLSTLDGCEKAIGYTVDKFGRIDILVNNAGIADLHKSTVGTDDELWNKVVGINLNAVFYLCRSALKHMEKQGSGNIVNVSSIGAFGLAGAAYSSTKAAVIALTKNIAIQYAGRGIRCNSTLPGPVPTALNTPEAMQHFDPEMREITGRHLDTSLPESETIDQANAILFFACDESKAITGQYLAIDNGWTL